MTLSMVHSMLHALGLNFLLSLFLVRRLGKVNPFFSRQLFPQDGAPSETLHTGSETSEKKKKNVGAKKSGIEK
jgi:hypothetical protein